MAMSPFSDRTRPAAMVAAPRTASFMGPVWTVWRLSPEVLAKLEPDGCGDGDVPEADDEHGPVGEESGEPARRVEFFRAEFS